MRLYILKISVYTCWF